MHCIGLLLSGSTLATKAVYAKPNDFFLHLRKLKAADYSGLNNP